MELHDQTAAITSLNVYFIIAQALTIAHRPIAAADGYAPVPQPCAHPESTQLDLVMTAQLDAVWHPRPVCFR